MRSCDVVRIVRARIKKWTKTQLAREAGLARATIIEIEKGIGAPRDDTWGALIEAMAIPQALLDSPPATEDEVIAEYKRLRSLDTAPVLGVQEGGSTPRRDNVKQLPHDASWWKRETMSDTKLTQPRLPGTNDPDAFYIDASGPEMTGGAGIEDGSILLIHPNAEAKHGDLVLIRFGDRSAVRRLYVEKGRLLAVTLHSKQTPVEITDTTETRVVFFVGRITKVP